MKTSYYYLSGVLVLLLAVGGWLSFMMQRDTATDQSAQNEQNEAQDTARNPMTFFLTSVNPGKGADLDGLAGADAQCQEFAESVGAGDRVWRAYLSTVATPDAPAVNARDRIGKGPWTNAKGVIIAKDLEELHGNNNISKQTALTEKGEERSGRGDPVNVHDILTGSTVDGLAIASTTDTTCANWTSSSTGSAMVGHHDRMGLRDDDPSKSWNSSHLSRGCSLNNLAASGGRGLFYCFAVAE